ncbi:maleylpyruvate isomerase N-terminal domain-containing protein [Kitasatospora sp. NPDC094015]|uniref:maleylpyruvate isomerase N-terminal domain-containing protein n=1 Tax=Kitasatospora sp. NPDC094015 TaxID=3155205 RepID=UPI00332E0CE9
MPDLLPPGPVTATDVEFSVALALETLGRAGSADWSVPAGPLEWDCWETTEHLADDLFCYAAQLTTAQSQLDGHVPFELTSRRPGGPRNAIAADRTRGTAALLRVLDAGGGLLAAVVRATPAERRAWHPYGESDPEGFAAMGVVEVLVHLDDLALGLGLSWTAPADLCARVLARLFPDAPTGTDPWPTLRWATGRGDLPGHPRPTSWRWDGRPRG